MRDRNGLPELRAPHAILRLLVEHTVQIKVKAGKIIADEKQQGVLGRANIDIGSRPGINMLLKAQRNRRALLTAGKQHRLKSRQDVAGVEFFLAAQAAMDDWLTG